MGAMAEYIFHVSDLNTAWARRSFDLATKRMEKYQDRLFDLAQKPTADLTTQDLLDVPYRDFLRTRELGLTARSKLEFMARQLGLFLARPYHYWKYHSTADFD